MIDFYSMQRIKLILVSFDRVDEEGLAKSTVMKQLRDMQGQMQEVLEDLETERESRNKAEKQKRDLNEVILNSITLT